MNESLWLNIFLVLCIGLNWYWAIQRARHVLTDFPFTYRWDAVVGWGMALLMCVVRL